MTASFINRAVSECKSVGNMGWLANDVRSSPANQIAEKHVERSHLTSKVGSTDF